MRFNVLTLISSLLSLACVLIGVTEVIGATTILKQYPALNANPFLNLPSLGIVLGGVLNVAFIQYPPGIVFRALGSMFTMFNQPRSSAKGLRKELQTILEWNEEIKRDRIKALENLEARYSKELAGTLFSLVATNYSNDDIRTFASVNIEENHMQKMRVVEVLRSMGGAGPAFGMFGTLFGLIVMLGNLDDPSTLGPALAAALITTLYGISFTRFLFYPIAEKIKNAAEAERIREMFILEGVVLINEKKSNFYIKDSLSSYLTRSQARKEAMSRNGEPAGKK